MTEIPDDASSAGELHPDLDLSAASNGAVCPPEAAPLVQPVLVGPGAQSAAHAADCVCAEFHRQQVWNTLDRAFPSEPHLWLAVEKLFGLSPQNPHAPDENERRAALTTAAQHIQQQLELTPEAHGPMDQMVLQFRRQMDAHL